MDLNAMIRFGLVVNRAYEIPPDQLTNSAGQIVTVSFAGVDSTYEVITTVYANDLATDMNPDRGKRRVSIGLVLQDFTTGDAVIAVRGTEGIHEWMQDARFLLVQCPFHAGAGRTEDGFTAMYQSLTTDPAMDSQPVARALAGLRWKKPVKTLTISGHSLGGALVTLLAMDVALNTQFTDPVVYSYASPRTGDNAFAATYDHVVPRTCRIANRMDLVPKLPMPPLYEHVTGLYELNPVILGLPPRVLVRTDLVCEHILTSYLHLLTHQAGGTVLPLEPQCAPR
jgi:Lipase (class 3)